MITAEQLKEMRERAIAWASDRGGNLVTREKAIGEDHMALDVLALLAEMERLTKHEAHINEEYQTMKDVLRAEHEACKRLRTALREACDHWEAWMTAEGRGPEPQRQRLDEIRKLAGGTP